MLPSRPPLFEAPTCKEGRFLQIPKLKLVVQLYAPRPLQNTFNITGMNVCNYHDPKTKEKYSISGTFPFFNEYLNKSLTKLHT